MNSLTSYFWWVFSVNIKSSNTTPPLSEWCISILPIPNQNLLMMFHQSQQIKKHYQHQCELTSYQTEPGDIIPYYESYS